MTGVQTCALPISKDPSAVAAAANQKVADELTKAQHREGQHKDTMGVSGLLDSSRTTSPVLSTGQMDAAKKAYDEARASGKTENEAMAAAAGALGMGAAGMDALKQHLAGAGLSYNENQKMSSDTTGANLQSRLVDTGFGKASMSEVRGSDGSVRKDYSLPVSGQENMHKFANHLKAHGLHDQARAVERAIGMGIKGFDGKYTTDAKGNVIAASGSYGGAMLFNDKGEFNTGVKRLDDNSDKGTSLVTRESGYKGRHGFSNEVLDRDKRDNWSGNINGIEFKNASWERVGNSTTVTGTPVGGASVITTGSYLDPKTGKPVETFTDQKGGTKYSAEGAVKELLSGNKTTLQHAMNGDKQGKRDYASKIAEEAAKLADVSYVQAKANSASANLGVKFGKGGTGAGFGVSSEYQKRQQAAVKQMNAQIQNIMASSGGSADIAAPRIQALIKEHEQMALNDYKSMKFFDESSKQHYTPEQQQAQREYKQAVWEQPVSRTEERMLAHKQAQAARRTPSSSNPSVRPR